MLNAWLCAIYRYERCYKTWLKIHWSLFDVTWFRLEEASGCCCWSKFRNFSPGRPRTYCIINNAGHRFTGLELLKHPPYSPDLAPMDFALFPYLKSKLCGQRFSDLYELRYATKDITQKLDKSWYEDTFYKWVKRHEKCVELRVFTSKKSDRFAFLFFLSCFMSPLYVCKAYKSTYTLIHIFELDITR